MEKETTENSYSPSDCFLTAYKVLKQEGWLGDQMQKDFALAVKTSPGTLSQVVSGKRAPGANLQVRVAESLGFRIDEFLRIGREILEGKGFFPYSGKVEGFPSHSEAQAAEIIRLTNEHHGLSGHLLGYRPSGWDDFIESKISAAEFYARYASELKSIIDTVDKRIKPKTK